MTLIDWLKHRKEYPLAKKVNLSNILNYASAEFRHWQSTSSFMNCPRHIEEQSIWRLSEVKQKSPLCIEMGKCKSCGCEMIDKSFELQECETGCYPRLMGKEKWEQYKKTNNIKIT